MLRCKKQYQAKVSEKMQKEKQIVIYGRMDMPSFEDSRSNYPRKAIVIEKLRKLKELRFYSKKYRLWKCQTWKSFETDEFWEIVDYIQKTTFLLPATLNTIPIPFDVRYVIMHALTYMRCDYMNLIFLSVVKSSNGKMLFSGKCQDSLILI